MQSAIVSVSFSNRAGVILSPSLADSSSIASTTSSSSSSLFGSIGSHSSSQTDFSSDDCEAKPRMGCTGLDSQEARRFDQSVGVGTPEAGSRQFEIDPSTPRCYTFKFSNDEAEAGYESGREDVKYSKTSSKKSRRKLGGESSTNRTKGANLSIVPIAYNAGAATHRAPANDVPSRTSSTLPVIISDEPELGLQSHSLCPTGALSPKNSLPSSPCEVRLRPTLLEDVVSPITSLPSPVPKQVASHAHKDWPVNCSERSGQDGPSTLLISPIGLGLGLPSSVLREDHRAPTQPLPSGHRRPTIKRSSASRYHLSDLAEKVQSLSLSPLLHKLQKANLGSPGTKTSPQIPDAPPTTPSSPRDGPSFFPGVLTRLPSLMRLQSVCRSGSLSPKQVASPGFKCPTEATIHSEHSLAASLPSPTLEDLPQLRLLPDRNNDIPSPLLSPLELPPPSADKGIPFSGATHRNFVTVEDFLGCVYNSISCGSI